MKTLKKTLCVVLALAMILGMSVTASAAFAGEQIKYTEAVDVMSALGVFIGDANGKFNPADTLTREQAAKVITYMILGKTAADALKTTAAPFKDVPADRWSAGSIAYCQANGILAGVGNGNFEPAGKLTGYAFAKMCLVALGYDAEIEGLTGSNWQVNVAKLISEASLGSKLGSVNMLAGMTREQAAQMAFNTEKATLVAYSSGVSVTTGATTVKVNATRSNVGNAAEAVGAGYAVGVATPYTQFCEKFAADLKLTSGGTDQFGRPSNVWTNDGVKVGTYAKSANLTYTADMNNAAGKKELKDAIKDFNNYNGAAVDLYKNGKKFATSLVATEANIAPLTGNGTVVEIFTASNEIKSVNVVDEFSGIVSKVNKTDETIDIDIYKTVSGTTSKVFTINTSKGYNKFAKDDIVVVTMDDSVDGVITTGPATENSVQSVAAPAKIVGLAKSISSSAYTVDGTAYKLAKNEAIKGGSFGVSAKYNATLYLDQYGYVIYAVPGAAAATADKLIVVAKEYQTLEEGVIVKKVKGVTSDGKEVDWKVTNTTAVPAATYTYVYNAAGDYTLATAVTTANATASAAVGTGANGVLALSAGITTDKASKSFTVGTETVYFADNVKFIYNNIPASSTTGKITALDGVQVATITTPVYVTVTKVDGAYYATSVAIEGVAPSSAVATGDIVYVASGTEVPNGYSVLVGDAEKKFSTYKAYIDGKLVENFFGDAGKQGFFYVKKDAATGAYVLDAPYTATLGKMAVNTGNNFASYGGSILTTDEPKDFKVSTIIDCVEGSDGTKYDTLAEMKAAAATKTVKLDILFNAETGDASCVFVRQVN